MYMCDGIHRDTLGFAVMWGEVPKMSETVKASKGLKQALLAPRPLSLPPNGHKMEIFPSVLTRRLYVPFYVGH